MKGQVRSKFLIALLVIGFGVGILKYFDYQYEKTDGFSVSSIQFEIPSREEWETKLLTSQEQVQLQNILQMKFTYLSKGARSYAFISENGEYVLKFFKFRYLTPHWTVRYLPAIPPFEYFRQKKINKVSLDTVLSGYSIAYNYDPDNTGLIYIHLNHTNDAYPSITVLDKEGRSHIVDLDHTRFIVQKRAQELSDILETHLREGNIIQAKQILLQTIDLYVSHYNKGIYDLGTGLIRNNGFIGKQPIHFDVGKMTLDERIQDPEFQYHVMVKMVKNADKWFISNYPQYRQEMWKALQNKLFEIYGKRLTDS